MSPREDGHGRAGGERGALASVVWWLVRRLVAGVLLVAAGLWLRSDPAGLGLYRWWAQLALAGVGATAAAMVVRPAAAPPRPAAVQPAGVRRVEDAGQAGVGRLPGGERCAYAGWYGIDVWGEHDHTVCADAGSADDDEVIADGRRADDYARWTSYEDSYAADDALVDE